MEPLLTFVTGIRFNHPFSTRHSYSMRLALDVLRAISLCTPLIFLNPNHRFMLPPQDEANFIIFDQYVFSYPNKARY